MWNLAGKLAFQKVLQFSFFCVTWSPQNVVEKDEQISHCELLLIRTFDNSDTFNCLRFEGI